MVDLLTVDVATANVTNTTFAHKLSLAAGPFGLRELESALSFPARNGRSWTLSIRTSDLILAIFTILVLTFAIDYCLFQNQYLVHIGGATKGGNHAATLDEKASLHEKEALNIESGLQRKNDKDSHLEASNSPVLKARAGWVCKAILIQLILLRTALAAGNMEKDMVSETHHEVLQSCSKAKSEAEVLVENSPPTSRWGKVVQHPRSQKIINSAMLLTAVPILLAVYAFHLLFWPMILTLFILLQCLFHEVLYPSVSVPWQSIALKSTLHLAIWTIIGVTLLLKPNRFQGQLWKGLKWTHAVNWWLFWVVLESYNFSSFAAQWIGLPYTRITTEVVWFIMRPSLVAYLYSGVVRDVFVAVRLCKYFWNNDFTSLGRR